MLHFLKNRFSLIFSVCILITAAILTIVLQNRNVGFEGAYDVRNFPHHGNVSANTLAIISRATWENHFVGYGTQFKNAQGQLEYDYFDRYPVFFSAVMNRILALRPKLSSKIYLAKQVMNLIFIATLVLAFLIINKLIKNKPLALAGVLLTFSNPFLLFYKDMVHFDQPALFGFLLIVYAIALYHMDGRKWPLYAATPLAIALGRGYASFAVLGLWLAIEGLIILRTRGLAFTQKVRQVVRHPSFQLLVFGILWGASLLSYNILIETQKRNISVQETSIIDSASRRLAVNQEFNQTYEKYLNWGGYIRSEVSRIIQWSSPVKWLYPSFKISLVLLLIMFGVIGLMILRQPLEKRIIYTLLAFSGFFWLIPLRNLAAFHDYTTMYFIGIPLVFFIALALLLKPLQKAGYFLAVLSLVVFVFALIQVSDMHQSAAGSTGELTYDFMRIEDQLASTGNNIFMEQPIPERTYAADFYLQDQYLSALPVADYVISTDRNHPGENLTPQNQFFFLFRK